MKSKEPSAELNGSSSVAENGGKNPSTLSSFLEAYSRLDWGLTPLKGKRPYLQDWTSQPRTAEFISKEIEMGRADNVGVLTGKPSRFLLALDVDEPELIGYDPAILREKGALLHTTSTGLRCVFFGEEELSKLSRKVAVRRKELSQEDGKLLRNTSSEHIVLAELLAEGRQFVAPPSVHPETKQEYKWETLPPSEATGVLHVSSIEELRQLLLGCFKAKWVVEELVPLHSGYSASPRESKTSTDVLEALEPFRARTYANWVMYHCPLHPPDNEPSLTYSVKSKRLIDFHTDELVDMDELRRRMGIEPEMSETTSSGPRRAMAERIVQLVLDSGEVFRDQFGDGFAHIESSTHTSTLKLRTRTFRQLVAFKMYEASGNVPSSEALKAAIDILEGKALFAGERYDLDLRTRWEDGAVIYDPGWEDWRLVRISRDGVEVIDNDRPRFRRYGHMRPQPSINTDEGEVRNAKTLLNFFPANLRTSQLEGRGLFWLVTVISYFVPGMAHPIPLPHGPQGSGKSLTFKIVRSTVDPSALPILSKPDSAREFAQQLMHNYCALYDNVSHLSDWEADVICRAVTGDGFTKRELFSDEDDVIFAFRRVVGLNGINIASSRPACSTDRFPSRSK